MKIGKRESQRLMRRAQIIAMAREHFFEHGYDGTSMSAIATALGGSKGTLWNYFPSKEELFAAVVEDTAAGIRGGMDVSGKGDTLLDALTNLCRTIIERSTAPIVLQMYRLVSPMADRHPAVAKLFFERGPARTQVMLGDYLREHFAGLLITDDYLTAGIDLMALSSADMHFRGIWGISGPPSAKEKEQRARHAAELFIRAYAREPRQLLDA
jgi:AcrR family transcriptional regulator